MRIVVVLPDPFGPEEAVHPTGGDHEVEAVDGHDAPGAAGPVDLAQPRGLDHQVRHVRTSS